MDAVIKIEGLTKLYGSVVGVRDLDLEIYEGEIFGFLGPNGSGKTTTMRMLTGFLRPTSGRATVLGFDVWKDSVKIKSNLGFLPDSPALYDSLTGNALLDYLGRLQQRGEPALRATLCQQLELSESDLRRKIKAYSRGMRQKLAIVQALQHDPAILVLDEPTDGLDPLMQQALFQILRDFQTRGRTIFMSSHILPEVERLCHRVAIIRDGSLVAVEHVDELLQRRVRHMDVVLAGDGPVADFQVPGVVSMTQDGRALHFLVKGSIAPLLKELAKLDVEDMVFEQAHLEDIFLDFYQDGEDGQDDSETG